MDSEGFLLRPLPSPSTVLSTLPADAMFRGFPCVFTEFLQRDVSIVLSTPSTMGRGVENVSINLQRGVPLPAPRLFNEGTQWPSLAA